MLKNIHILDSVSPFLKIYPHEKYGQKFMYTNAYFSVFYINNNKIR